MSNSWGDNISVSIFGESHGVAIGVTIDGLPSGLSIDVDSIKEEMKRRAPGNSDLSTPRKERDKFDIVSGYFDGKLTGTPLCAIIYNEDKRSRDYSKIKSVMRPGHADYTGFIKYRGFNDYRGGGHFSGRLTAPLVFAGAIAKQILNKKDICIGAHIRSIKDINDETFLDVKLTKDRLEKLSKMTVPTLQSDKSPKMEDEILRAKNESDSVGGQIEVAVLNVPAGLGSPFFDSVESKLAHMIFSIPGVKGIEFGSGFDITSMKGSDANDEYHISGGKVRTLTNNNGGILGGISSGMPIIFNTALKPTPSIGKAQNTINIEERRNTELKVEGRHDPCIVTRAVPVLEAATAIVILDILLERNGELWMN